MPTLPQLASNCHTSLKPQVAFSLLCSQLSAHASLTVLHLLTGSSTLPPPIPTPPRPSALSPVYNSGLECRQDIWSSYRRTLRASNSLAAISLASRTSRQYATRLAADVACCHHARLRKSTSRPVALVRSFSIRRTCGLVRMRGARSRGGGILYAAV